MRWAPTAANKQPCRVVRCGGDYHFYEKHTMPQAPQAPWDVQKIDLGIALCNFMAVTDADLRIADPGIACAEGTEYIATVSVR